MNIAVISEAGGGKDFLADYLISNYGYTRYAFADHVRKVAKKWFPELYGDGTEKPRWLLQAIGTKFREIYEYVWIDSMFEEIDKEAAIRKRFKEASEFIVITDCRMPNEYKALKERGFKFIRIQVDPRVRQQRLLSRGDKFTEDDLKHHTESFYNQFECDFTIYNNTTQAEAYQQLDSVLASIIEMKVTG